MQVLQEERPPAERVQITPIRQRAHGQRQRLALYPQQRPRRQRRELRPDWHRVSHAHQKECRFKLVLGLAGSPQPSLNHRTKVENMGDIVENLLDNTVCEVVETAEPRFRPHIAVTLSSIPLKGLYNTGVEVSCLNKLVHLKMNKKTAPLWTLVMVERGSNLPVVSN